MKLYDILENLSTPLPNCEISGVTDNTKNVCDGMIFVCIKGGHFDGHTAAAEMLEKGAVCVIAERDLGLGDRQILVENTHAAYGDLCAAWYGHPERKMKFVGVTGTNGKTTIATVMQQMLKKAGHKVGLIGTVQYEIGEEILPSPNTTPLTDSYFSLLKKMADAGCDTVVMEVSSFGLEQHRIGPTHFDTAIYTNLTQDHLDIHGTMENYYQAKKLLFLRCDYAIVNTADEYGARLFDEITCEKRSYRLAENGTSADITAKDWTLGDGGTEFSLSLDGEELAVRMKMIGLFNIYNVMAAMAAGKRLGIPTASMCEMLKEYGGVRGRCEVISTGKEFSVICDYAHTPDALEKTLSSLRECVQGKIIALFGCGGNRDATKRPKMAKAAAKYADLIVVTSDNPRDENPLQIMQDIIVGLEGCDTPYIAEPDRAEAIFLAMQQAKAGDVVLLAGKGHEDYQIIEGGVKLHMDERELVAEGLQRL